MEADIKKILAFFLSLMILAMGVASAQKYSETYEYTSGGSSSNHLYIHRYVLKTSYTVYEGYSQTYYRYGIYGNINGQNGISTTWNSMGMLSWSNSHTTFEYQSRYGNVVERTNSLAWNATQYVTYSFICGTTDNYFGGTTINEFNGYF